MPVIMNGYPYNEKSIKYINSLARVNIYNAVYIIHMCLINKYNFTEQS